MKYYDIRGSMLLRIEESIQKRFGRPYAQLTASERASVDAALADMSSAQPASAPRRQTFVESQYSEPGGYGYEQPGSPFSEGLGPENWKALADRRVPWPHDKVDPRTALHELAGFAAYRMLSTQAQAMGRSVGMAFGLRPEDEL